MRMWRWYFGPKATIIGVDIEPVTRVYQGDPKYGAPDQVCCHVMRRLVGTGGEV